MNWTKWFNENGGTPIAFKSLVDRWSEIMPNEVSAANPDQIYNDVASLMAHHESKTAELEALREQVAALEVERDTALEHIAKITDPGDSNDLVREVSLLCDMVIGYSNLYTLVKAERDEARAELSKAENTLARFGHPVDDLPLGECIEAMEADVQNWMEIAGDRATELEALREQVEFEQRQKILAGSAVIKACKESDHAADGLRTDERGRFTSSPGPEDLTPLSDRDAAHDPNVG